MRKRMPRPPGGGEIEATKEAEESEIIWGVGEKLGQQGERKKTCSLKGNV